MSLGFCKMQDLDTALGQMVTWFWENQCNGPFNYANVGIQWLEEKSSLGGKVNECICCWSLIQVSTMLS